MFPCDLQLAYFYWPEHVETNKKNYAILCRFEDVIILLFTRNLEIDICKRIGIALSLCIQNNYNSTKDQNYLEKIYFQRMAGINCMTLYYNKLLLLN